MENFPLKLDVKYLEPEVTSDMIIARKKLLAAASENLHSGDCAGADFTGWINPSEICSPDEINRIKTCAKRLSDETDVLLVIGIGGSYLGARAVIEALADDPDKVVYAGQNISANYMNRLKRQLAGKRVAINIISKSGTTTEPAVAFRILKELVSEASESKLIIATTDAQKGALHDLAKSKGYESFVVPGNIGGRYSVLSAVGLLPIAYAGINIDDLIKGAVDSAEKCKETDPAYNPAFYYAAARNVFYHQGKTVEIMASFEPRLHYFAEWWKQLFGESEGKENQALFPASVDFTTDLHSLGQYVQEGRRIIMETFLIIDECEETLTLPSWDADSDGLNYLAGKEVSYINNMAYKATAHAHREGGVPNMTIRINKLNAYSLGFLIYFFEISCALGGLLLGVNPFDQPGVEAYKKYMFELLEKPGYTRCVMCDDADNSIGFKNI